MEISGYQIIMINGRIIEFDADAVEDNMGFITFYLEGEAIGEFKKDNIAGYLAVGTIEGEEDD